MYSATTYVFCNLSEEDYIWEAFFAILKSHLEIEKHKSKSQISIWVSFCLTVRLVNFFFRLYFFLFFSVICLFQYRSIAQVM